MLVAITFSCDLFKASRLVATLGTPMILGPTMARLGAPLPRELIKALGGGNIKRSTLPTHIHRSKLLIPPPLPLRGDVFAKRLSRPRGCIVNTQPAKPTLHWHSISVSAKKKAVYLAGVSPTLPSYFTRTLEKLGLIKTNLLTAVESNSNV